MAALCFPDPCFAGQTFLQLISASQNGCPMGDLREMTRYFPHWNALNGFQCIPMEKWDRLSSSCGTPLYMGNIIFSPIHCSTFLLLLVFFQSEICLIPPYNIGYFDIPLICLYYFKNYIRRYSRSMFGSMKRYIQAHSATAGLPSSSNLGKPKSEQHHMHSSAASADSH